MGRLLEGMIALAALGLACIIGLMGFAELGRHKVGII